MHLGADATVPHLRSAAAAVGSATSGRGVDGVIMAMSVGDGRLIADALPLLGKRGRLVVVNVHPETERSVSLSMRDLQLYEKQFRGCLSTSRAAAAMTPPRSSTGPTRSIGSISAIKIRLPGGLCVLSS